MDKKSAVLLLAVFLLGLSLSGCFRPASTPPASSCVPGSSFSLVSASHAASPAGDALEGPRRYPGVYPVWIAKHPVFAALFERFLPSSPGLPRSLVRRGAVQGEIRRPRLTTHLTFFQNSDLLRIC